MTKKQRSSFRFTGLLIPCFHALVTFSILVTAASSSAAAFLMHKQHASTRPAVQSNTKNLGCRSPSYIAPPIPTPTPRRCRHCCRSLLQMSVGDIVSGLIGIPPSNLQPPNGLLSGTSIDPTKSNVDLRCVYKATQNGWSALDFHNAVDGRGSGLVILLTRSGRRLGAFNPLGWMSTDDYGNSNAAFLWFERGAGGEFVRCPILSGGNAAIYDYATGGPCFGSADLRIGAPQAAIMGGFAGPDAEDIKSSAGNLKKGFSSVGGTYGYQNGWPVGGEFSIVEVEVYCNANIKPVSGGGNWWPF